MGRAPCCDKANVKRGPWSPEEDAILKKYLEKHGTGGSWIVLPHKAGLKRCGKSCRLRWLNYLRPDIKHGGFTEEEDKIICTLHGNIGSKWSQIASRLPGRTDNDVKNYWNTKLKKRVFGDARIISVSGSKNKNSPDPMASNKAYSTGNLTVFDANTGTMPPLMEMDNWNRYCYYSNNLQGLILEETKVPVSTSSSSFLLPASSWSRYGGQEGEILPDLIGLDQVPYEQLNCLGFQETCVTQYDPVAPY